MSDKIETVMIDAIIRIETKMAELAANQKTMMDLLIALHAGDGIAPGEPAERKTATATVDPATVDTLPREVSADLSIMRDMTPKQHVVLQLIVRGWRNNRISELMDVTLNTTKQHIRTLMDKFGVRSRASVAVRAMKCLEYLSDRDYTDISGGLPKSWARDIESLETLDELEDRDPYFKIYAKSGTNARS